MASLPNDAALPRWPADRTTRVPFWLYSDPAIYRQEQEQVFGGKAWSRTYRRALAV